ncbi:amidohydrolase family protein [Streptomyces sp. 3MP-14]|uniref:Amidohydrolase family protein n=1 Tax=Streptomyces mimosae TaxID=2586635 RepID=A0A5N5ZSF5_9ACTN|nr:MULTISPECIES: amidohydrolase family protein [Streptomyces]KAB8159451.1 amidohydrolase family protein [Streptomyces mimosae]KAB8172661.1 amidohydrolase family protein [Streptomyces sp. 3MP-14]
MCVNDRNRRGFLRTAAAAGIAAASVPALAAATAHGQEPAPAGGSAAAGEKIALTNARVFDGDELTEPRTVVVENGRIGLNSLGARRIDCEGAVLLPGLIDAHLHLRDLDTLRRLAGFGVTTGLDMACFPPEVVDSLRRQPGLPDIRSAGTPAVAPGSPQSQLPTFPQDAVLTGPEQAATFVRNRVTEGSDYIKIVIDEAGPTPETVGAVAAQAHSAGKLLMAHATTAAQVEVALAAGADMIHHIPLDSALTPEIAARFAAGGPVAVPTLTMMEGFANLGIPGYDYANAEAGVAELHRAGARVLAGTDANLTPGIPVQPAYGDSLHHELELLVAAGLSTREALRAATVLPAQSFRLRDRGEIRPGYRADLLLVDGDPLADITATRAVRRVWVGGAEHAPAAG